MSSKESHKINIEEYPLYKIQVNVLENDPNQWVITDILTQNKATPNLYCTTYETRSGGSQLIKLAFNDISNLYPDFFDLFKTTLFLALVPEKRHTTQSRPCLISKGSETYLCVVSKVFSHSQSTIQYTRSTEFNQNTLHCTIVSNFEFIELVNKHKCLDVKI